MSTREDILTKLITARDSGTLSEILRDLANHYSRSNQVTYTETLRRLGQSAGIQPNTVRAIIRGQIKHPPNERLEGFATVLAAKNTQVRASHVFAGSEAGGALSIEFDGVWKDLQEIIGDGIRLETLVRRMPNAFYFRGDGILVEANHGVEILPREWIESTWRLLTEDPVSESKLPGLNDFVPQHC